MCLCKGTGSIQEYINEIVKFKPCPDSNCTFDKAKADSEYEMWVKRGIEYYRKEQHSKATTITS